MSHSSSLGRSLLGFVLLASVALAAMIAARPRTGGDASGDGAPEPPPPPANTDEAVLMYRVDLGADALAAAGLDAVKASAVVAAVEAEFNKASSALGAADDVYGSAKATYEALLRKSQNGLASEQELASFSAIEAAYNSAVAARLALIDGYFNVGIAALAPTEQLTLQTIRKNRWWNLPVQYLVVDRDEKAWVDLREALSAKEINQIYGEEFAQEAQDTLAAVDAEQKVAGAKVLVETNLATVQIAWNAAVSD